MIETPAYLRAADQAGVLEDERNAIVTAVGLDPEMGDLMSGTGGCRKVRFTGRGKGKSGGYRVITFYSGRNIPVFLLTVFGKGEKANLTRAERNALAGLSKLLIESLTHNVDAQRK